MSNFTPEQIQEILDLFFENFAHRQYIGARYVPIFGRKDEESIEWDNTGTYEPLTIVLYQGNSYTSRQFVPVGVAITNLEYWAPTGTYNAQVEAYRQEVYGFGAMLPDTEFDSENTVLKAIQFDVSKARVFDTIANMKSSNTLAAGMICHTNGFAASGDGGAAWYEITDTGTANEMDVIACGDLYATLIIGDTINVRQIGCLSDPDNSSNAYFEQCLSLCDRVYVNPGTYVISDLFIPEEKEIYGSHVYSEFAESGTVDFENASVIKCVNDTSAFLLSSNSKVHDFVFIEPDFDVLTASTLSTQYDYCINTQNSVNVFNNEIYNICFANVYKGLSITPDNGYHGGKNYIHDIVGYCVGVCIDIDNQRDFNTIENCSFMEHWGRIHSSATRAVYAGYCREHTIVFQLGRNDYSTFSNIQVYVARYGIYAEYNQNESRGVHNCIFDNLSFDCVGNAVYTPNDNYEHILETSFINSVFTTGLSISESPNPAKYGEFCIDVTKSKVIVNNCMFSGIEYSIARARSSANVVISNCLIQNAAASNDVQRIALHAIASQIVFSNNKFIQAASLPKCQLCKNESSGKIYIKQNVISNGIVLVSPDYLADGIEYSDNYIDGYNPQYGVQNLDVCNIPCNNGSYIQSSNALTDGSTYQLPIAFLKKFRFFSISTNRYGRCMSLGPVSPFAIEQGALNYTTDNPPNTLNYYNTSAQITSSVGINVSATGLLTLKQLVGSDDYYVRLNYWN